MHRKITYTCPDCGEEVLIDYEYSSRATPSDPRTEPTIEPDQCPECHAMIDVDVVSELVNDDDDGRREADAESRAEMRRDREAGR